MKNLFMLVTPDGRSYEVTQTSAGFPAGPRTQPAVIYAAQDTKEVFDVLALAVQVMGKADAQALREKQAEEARRQRVIEEKAELDARLEKLYQFLKGDIFLTLDQIERARLMHQLVIMQDYSAILGARIQAFK